MDYGYCISEPTTCPVRHASKWLMQLEWCTRNQASFSRWASINQDGTSIEVHPYSATLSLLLVCLLHRSQCGYHSTFQTHQDKRPSLNLKSWWTSRFQIHKLPNYIQLCIARLQKYSLVLWMGAGMRKSSQVGVARTISVLCKTIRSYLA